VVDEDRDPETGRYTLQFTDEELLTAVSVLEPAGTTEIAERFECSQPAAFKRLQQLEDAGEIRSKMVGGNRVWMTTSSD